MNKPPSFAHAAKSGGNKLAKKLTQAIAAHQLGELAAAERLYRSILASKPNHFDALHLLGVIEHQKGRYREAERLIGRALKINPQSAAAHVNHGLALQALDRHEDALASYDRALALKPEDASVLNNRGTVLQALKRPEDALASIDRAIALRTGYDRALYNRGIALQDLGRTEEALASFDRALALKPDYIPALYNRGIALANLKRPEDALASFERALALKPDYVEALNTRGNALRDLNRPEEALSSYDRALALKPDEPDALNNRGNALRDLRRFEEALSSYDRALALKPDYVEALNNRGIVLRDLKRPEEALTSLARAIEIKPDYAEAIFNRGKTFAEMDRPVEATECYVRALEIRPDYAEVLSERGSLLNKLKLYDEAIEDFEHLLRIDPHYPYAKGNYLHAKMYCCNWASIEEDVRGVIEGLRAGERCDYPWAFLGISDSPEDQLACARIFTASEYPPSRDSLWKGERYGHDKIHVAYISSDFRNHAMAYLIAGLFELHDRSRFVTTAISIGPDTKNEMRGRIERAFDRFIDAREKSDRAVAELLRELEVDIAVDLNGFTAHSRPGILALRPAPVQVSYLGLPGTMGAGYIDYIIADRVIIPEDRHDCYAEKIVYLPDTYFVNDSKRRIAEATPTRAEAGLPDAGFVFCSFNNNYKITPPVFDVWMRLLREVDGSVLWLLQSNDVSAKNLRREAESRGVAPDQLVFAPKIEPADHLARHRLADLSLDTLPCNAHTTASDALWAGLPVLTCLGTTFAGRVAASLLNAVGLPELITHSIGEYEALAMTLAKDRQAHAAIKAKLALNRTSYPLFDTDRFRRHIEAAYVAMWERAQRGEKPSSFAVDPIAA